MVKRNITKPRDLLYRILLFHIIPLSILNYYKFGGKREYIEGESA